MEVSEYRPAQRPDAEAKFPLSPWMSHKRCLPDTLLAQYLAAAACTSGREARKERNLWLTLQYFPQRPRARRSAHSARARRPLKFFAVNSKGYGSGVAAIRPMVPASGDKSGWHTVLFAG